MTHESETQDVLKSEIGNVGIALARRECFTCDAVIDLPMEFVALGGQAFCDERCAVEGVALQSALLAEMPSPRATFHVEPTPRFTFDCVYCGRDTGRETVSCGECQAKLAELEARGVRS
jgi:hypothetical protein